MKEAIRLIFWGFFFVFLRIDIGIDWLPDPLGYFLIASGCSKLKLSYPVARKAGILSTLMIFVSFPTIFVNVGVAKTVGWEVYSYALLLFKLLVVYFLFSILTCIVKDFGDTMLIVRTNRIYRFYIGMYLTLLAYLSFAMNVSGNFWEFFAIIMTVGVLIMDILFLLLLRAIRRAAPSYTTRMDNLEIKSPEDIAGLVPQGED